MYKQLFNFGFFGFEFYFEYGNYPSSRKYLDWEVETMDTHVWVFECFYMIVSKKRIRGAP